jgi:hypothetical protein
MYGHMQEACRLDEMEARQASEDVQTKRLWRYVPKVLNVIPSMLSEEEEEEMDLIENEEVQQVVGQANQQTIAFAEANLITAFQLYISYSIKTKNSLATLVKMLTKKMHSITTISEIEA